jgi:hypothetical protein
VKLEAIALLLLIALILFSAPVNVAHTLAQYVLRAEDECVGWADFAPPIVSDLVASKLAASSG